MTKAVRIKRRLSGEPGAPAQLLNAELAFNEISGVLYYGRGLEPDTTASEIIEIGGFGAFVGLAGSQQISGEKTFLNSTFFAANVFAPTPPTNDSSNRLATTAFVKSQNYATLVNGLIPAEQLPGFIDDIVEYGDESYLPEEGEAGKLYVITNTGRVYRWSGSMFVEIVASPGTTDAIAEGSINLFLTPDRVFTYSPVKSVVGRTGDVFVTQNDIGLTNVNNTADIDKPISIAMQFALDAKAELVHTHVITDVVDLSSTLTTITQSLSQKVNVTDIIDGGGF